MIIGIDAHNLEGQRTGVGQYLLNLLKEWTVLEEASGHRFILYFKNKIPDDLNLGNQFESRLLSVKSTAFFTHYALPKTAQKDKIDVLFCPGYIAPIFYSGKIILTLHDIIYEVHPNWYNWPSQFDKILLKKISKWSAKKAQIIFTPSQFTKNEVVKYYQIPEKKIFITPLGAAEIFRPLDIKKEEARLIKNKYQIKDKFIFYLGSVFNRRHLPEAIAAFEKIASKFENYQFLIVGHNFTRSFVDVKKIILWANEKLNREALIWIDYISSKESVYLYNLADLFIYLSDYEGFGLPPLEAMQCGVPVITSNKASLPEVVGEAAILIGDNNDIEQISQVMEEGLINQSLRQLLREKGLARAKNFSWSKCAQQTLKRITYKA